MGEQGDGALGVVAGLVRSAFLVNAVYAESAREHGLTAQQGQLLCVLMARPYGMSELGGVLGLAKSSVTGLVDRCERINLVWRGPSAEDSRAVRVYLTVRGERLAATFYAETCRRIERLSAGLGDADRRLLADLLGRIVLDNQVPAVFLELDDEATRGRAR
ncbi:MarR family winged helix-turn-helix transcriptional regulator [Frankia canadensis]|uniref:MarR family winged helix-turn-helix transcriptional regulator n=1 Tax=Frankia canadensis TaxID=1836972 RepID=UPI001A9C8FA2|nr:MarR family winged helix-turn-helix transcriptional regulator [Frankia canadensis]